MNSRASFAHLLRRACLVASLAACGPAFAAATLNIINNDGAGEGFNDPTPVAPVGGNPGTTLGQQRLNAFQHAANIWGATLDSTVVINIRANFDPLACTATSAVLGSAGAITVHADFPNAPFTGTWYSAALANKLAASDLDPTLPEIAARFNVNLGQPGCLTGSPFYLGVDNIVPTGQINLVAVLLHEFGHGLGFQAFLGSTGRIVGPPFLNTQWERFMRDNTTGKTYDQMTDAEIATSVINSRRVVWTGSNVTVDVPNVLSAGTPLLNVNSAPIAGVVGSYDVGAASFGPPLFAPGVTQQLMPLRNPANLLACSPITGSDATAIAGRIALIDRGTCAFTTKVKNAQDVGAVGVVIADNVAGSPPAGLGGADPTIVIPSVRITLADGTKLKNALRYRSRTASGVVATLGVDLSVRAGADPAGRVLLYTPNPYQGGSSVSHWDTSAFPNLLMEPAINADLTQSVIPPQDLTFPLLRDIGW